MDTYFIKPIAFHFVHPCRLALFSIYACPFLPISSTVNINLFSSLWILGHRGLLFYYRRNLSFPVRSGRALIILFREMPQRTRSGDFFLILVVCASTARIVIADSKFDILSVTPSADLLTQIFSTESQAELPDQTFVLEATSNKWLERTTPYLLCTTDGRPGVEEALSSIDPSAYRPFHADENLTCHIVTSKASEIQSVVSRSSHVKYATPVPASLKLARGFFELATGGSYLVERDNCQNGVRVILSPGIDQSSELESIAEYFTSDLTSGAYKDRIANDFLWVSKYSPLGSASVVKAFQNSTAKTPKRGQTWLDYLTPVLDGTYTCDFGSLNISAKTPYVGVQNTCSLLPGNASEASESEVVQASSCMVALLAYLISDSNVFYTERYHQHFPNNDLGHSIVQVCMLFFLILSRHTGMYILVYKFQPLGLLFLLTQASLST